MRWLFSSKSYQTTGLVRGSSYWKFSPRIAVLNRFGLVLTLPLSRFLVDGKCWLASSSYSGHLRRRSSIDFKDHTFVP